MATLELTCDICHNKGWVYERSDTDGWVVKPCKCHKRRESLRRLKRSGLENVIQSLTLENYQDTHEWQKQALRKAKEYASSPKGWFFIGGQVGAGKTHLCTGICRVLLLEGKGVIYAPWRDTVTRLKACMNDFAYGDEIDRMRCADVLYVDDLFKGGTADRNGEVKPTQADVNIAYGILDYRYTNDLPTILSGEKTIDELMNIDQAVGSRIYQMSKNGFEINLDRAPDRNYRLRAVQARGGEAT